jgi:hypothetical protein
MIESPLAFIRLTPIEILNILYNKAKRPVKNGLDGERAADREILL